MLLVPTMTDVQKISISLPKKLNAIVKKAVASGEYSSASEVVREALRHWENREKARKAALQHMRALIQEGIDSGPGREIDFAELKAELRAELVRKKDSRRRAA